MPKKVAGRKEQRKAARVAVKVRKNQSTMERQKQPVETQAEGHVNAISKKSGRAAGEKDSRVSKKEKKQRSGEKNEEQDDSASFMLYDDMVDPSNSNAAAITAENREIDRLTKLLGLETKKKSAAKLNKEYAMYEGIGDNFGSFLMDLDNIGNSSYEGKIFDDDFSDGDGDDDIEEVKNVGHHIIDDDEQEKDDVELIPDDFDENDLDDEEMLSTGSVSSEEGNESDGSMLETDEDGESEAEDSDVEEQSKDEEDDEEEEVYRPVEGEDIYGRSVTTEFSTTGSKYVPPARRAAQMAAVDDKSTEVQSIRRQINGLMNRLSDQTKDTVVRDLKGIFDKNSLTITCNVLKECIMGACSNPTQMMAALIPIYASVIAALHFVVGLDVGAYLVESFATALDKALKEESSASNHALIGSKLAHNCLLSLIYLYNLRILHHQLIVDVMELLAGSEDNIDENMKEIEAELLGCIFDHCGTQLRSDDPVKLRSVFNILTKKSANASNNRNNDQNTRIQYLLESLTDLKNNKSKRVQNIYGDEVKKIRRWLGTIKINLNAKPGDYQLRVSLNDLLNAENSGRWWRAGASWVGKQNNVDSSNAGESIETKDKPVLSSEEQKLLKIAKKMRFNTTTRKNIFVIIMSSRDINDAFERLARMELKGKEDREIVRVLVECCGQEKTFNKFYAELASLLCAHNRQFKTTLQFSFWDTFKSLDDEEEISERRTINLSLMMAHLVGEFHLPLSIIKPIDMRELNERIILFLATFFMALFSGDVPDDTFQSILDRVATTKDFATVRETILVFLQRYLTSIPPGANPENRKGMEKRRKATIKTMESLSVLDYREEDDGGDNY